MVPIRFAVAVSLCVLVVSAPARAQVLSTDGQTVNQAESLVAFTIRGSALLPVKRDGQFKEFSGQVAYDAAQPGRTRVNLTVYTASVDVRNVKQNQLLMSREFFDVEHFPTLQFASSNTVVNPDGTLSMTGDMTIRGITRRMTIPVTIRPAAAGAESSGAVFESTFQVDRTQFGLNGVPRWSGFKVSIARDVQIHLAIATGLRAQPRR